MDKKRTTTGTTLAFAVLCLSIMVPNYAQYQISPIGANIIKQYNLTLSQFSSLFSAPMIPAIFFSLVAGILLDKFGCKIVIGIGLIFTAIGCIWRITSGSYMPLFTATLMTGFSACFITAGSGKIVGRLFEAKDVPEKMGLLMAFSTAAMAIANFTSAYFSSLHALFITSAGFAVIATVLWFLFAKKNDRNVVDEKSVLTIKDCLQVTLKSKTVWLISFALFFVMAANMVVGSFLPTALGTRNVSAEISGAIAGLYTVGNFIGCLVTPICIGKLHSQKKVLILFAIFAALGIAFVWIIPSVLVLTVGMILTGTFLGGMIPTLMGLPVQLTEIGPDYAGTAGGVVGTVQLLGAVILPSYVLTPIAGNNFILLFILGGLCMVCAAILCLGMKSIE